MRFEARALGDTLTLDADLLSAVDVRVDADTAPAVVAGATAVVLLA
jgi:hypothetical protein